MGEADKVRTRRRALLLAAAFVSTIIFASGITALVGLMMLVRGGAVALDMLMIVAAISAIVGGACLTRWAWKYW